MTQDDKEHYIAYVWRTYDSSKATNPCNICGVQSKTGFCLNCLKKTLKIDLAWGEAYESAVKRVRELELNS